ncbi:MAG: hypothetical protein ACM31G_09680 [Flavobacteriales bacterium]
MKALALHIAPFLVSGFLGFIGSPLLTAVLCGIVTKLLLLIFDDQLIYVASKIKLKRASIKVTITKFFNKLKK